MPKVSVIIPTCSRAKMLRRAIESVLAQTWQGNMEIIVVSDGSTDNTEKAVGAFGDPRIRFFKHEESRGASAARNTGLKESRGKYIAFLDDDDEWTRDKLEVQMPVIEDSPPEVGLVYAWMEYVRDDGKRVWLIDPELRGNVFVEMLDKQAIGGCPTIIIKREVIDKIGYFDETLPRGNDGDYWRRISKHYHVDYVPEILAIIHVGHGDRISVNNRKNLKDAIFSKQARLRKFSEEFKEHPNIHCRFLLMIAGAHLRLFLPHKAIRWTARAWKVASDNKRFIHEFTRSIFRGTPGPIQRIGGRCYHEFQWRQEIYIRRVREFLGRLSKSRSSSRTKTPPVVYMTGMPRTGSSLMKNYFGDFPGLEIMPFQRKGFFDTWEKSAQCDDILIDKSTHYIRNLNDILVGTAGRAAFCCIVRDPRDQLTSLFEFDGHPELPRTKRFWKKWVKQYSSFLRFAEQRHNARCFLIRYEDLVLFPVEAKTAFLEWIGLDVRAEPITPEYRVAHDNDIQDPKVSRNNKVVPRSIGCYRKTEGARLKNLIEGYKDFEEAGKLMHRLDYGTKGLFEIKEMETSNFYVFSYEPGADG
ncbi:MAG: glycosyltransferase [Proteobacteria bacterium]|nr:glycosyltransferase [Pseudomonadota bacterium]